MLASLTCSPFVPGKPSRPAVPDCPGGPCIPLMPGNPCKPSLPYVVFKKTVEKLHENFFKPKAKQLRAIVSLMAEGISLISALAYILVFLVAPEIL